MNTTEEVLQVSHVQTQVSHVQTQKLKTSPSTQAAAKPSLWPYDLPREKFLKTEL